MYVDYSGIIMTFTHGVYAEIRGDIELAQLELALVPEAARVQGHLENFPPDRYIGLTHSVFNRRSAVVVSSWVIPSVTSGISLVRVLPLLAKLLLYRALRALHANHSSANPQFIQRPIHLDLDPDDDITCTG